MKRLIKEFISCKAGDCHPSMVFRTDSVKTHPSIRDKNSVPTQDADLLSFWAAPAAMWCYWQWDAFWLFMRDTISVRVKNVLWIAVHQTCEVPVFECSPKQVFQNFGSLNFNSVLPSVSQQCGLLLCLFLHVYYSTNILFNGIWLWEQQVCWWWV